MKNISTKKRKKGAAQRLTLEWGANAFRRAEKPGTWPGREK